MIECSWRTENTLDQRVRPSLSLTDSRFASKVKPRSSSLLLLLVQDSEPLLLLPCDDETASSEDQGELNDGQRVNLLIERL